MSENSGLRDQLASPYHRLTGKCSLLSDTDLVVTTAGDVFEKWAEYTRNINKQAFDGSHNAHETVAYIDYKRMPSNKVLGQLKFYLQESDDRKKPVPVFACLTYLDPIYTIKCYHIIPVCKLAERFFSKHNYNIAGEWMSLQKFSNFMHQLRKREWKEMEFIDNKDIQTILNLDASAPLRKIKYQKDLPTTLPDFTKPEHQSLYKIPDLTEIMTIKMRIR